MKVKVGVVQESPIFFDKKATLEKIENLVSEHSKEGCQLLVFPESFIPGYPRGFDFGAKVGSRNAAGKALYAEYHANSIALKSPEMDFLVELSKEHNCYLVMGITEKNEINDSLFCSMAYLSPTDGLMGVHRKVKPTGTERLIWAEDDGKSLQTFHTKIGKLGGLICWENYMPLARMSMYQNGVQIYLAPTADSRDGWTATMKHIALEGRCYVLGCNQYFAKSMYPEKFKSLVPHEQEEMCPGGSVIVSPQGEVLAGPLFGRSGVLTATLDLAAITNAKMDFDPVGHYNRPDIFKFMVPDQPEPYQEKDIEK